MTSDPSPPILAGRVRRMRPASVWYDVAHVMGGRTTVELTPEAERLLSDHIASGAGPDANAVIIAALSRLTRPAFDDEMLEALNNAEADVANGRVYRWEDVRQQVHDAFTKK